MTFELGPGSVRVLYHLSAALRGAPCRQRRTLRRVQVAAPDSGSRVPAYLVFVSCV